MVFASLLGTVKQPRRSSGTLRPAPSSSSSSSRSHRPDGEKHGDEADSQAVVNADDGSGSSDTASIQTANSATVQAAAVSRPPAALPPDFIADETQLRPLSAEAPDLRELNNSLDALAAVFPDVQVDVFREMLTSFDGESRLALVADALLKNRATWVKGRWRVADKGKADADRDNHKSPSCPSSSPSSSSSSSSSPSSSLPPADRFRTPEYQKAATALASHEFMGLSRSTINAVLAEQNYAYLEARRALVDISSKSLRFTLSALFLRRKPVTSTEAENHPLIVWKSSGQGSIIPTIKTTGSPELDRELYDALVAPLRLRQRAAQEEADRSMAAALNTAEAEAAGATYECTCCFATATFEEVTTCSNGDAAHIVCFRCVQHSVREAVFGQGWARTIDASRGTLRCPAVDSRDCDGIIPVDLLHRALLDEKRGGDTLRHLERRLADHSLVGSGLPLVHCPFCEYAEVDDIYVPFHEAPLRVRFDNLYSLALVVLLSGMTPVLMLPLLVLLSLVMLLPGIIALWRLLSASVFAPWSRRARQRRGGRHRRDPRAQQRSKPSESSSPAVVHRRRPLFSDYLFEQLAAAVTRFRRRRRGHQFRCHSPACARLSCLSCGKAWTDIHVCHESSLIALRTQVEQAMSMAIKRVCPRCHTSFVKTAGCNKLTCPCGYKMCYVCRKDISGNDGPDAGYRHFCDHFRPHGDGRPCNQCRRCNLWETEDTEAVLQAAREEAERHWCETERRELSLSERAYLETGIAINGGSGFSGSSGSGGAAATGGGGALAAAGRLFGAPITWGYADHGRGKNHNHRQQDADGAADASRHGTNHEHGKHRRHHRPRLPTLAETLDWLLEALFV